MAEETTGGPQPQVTKGPLEVVEVEILPNVDAFIDGKKVDPGKRAYTDMTSALHLVSEGHAKITGSR